MHSSLELNLCEYSYFLKYTLNSILALNKLLKLHVFLFYLHKLTCIKTIKNVNTQKYLFSGALYSRGNHRISKHRTRPEHTAKLKVKIIHLKLLNLTMHYSLKLNLCEYSYLPKYTLILILALHKLIKLHVFLFYLHKLACIKNIKNINTQKNIFSGVLYLGPHLISQLTMDS